MGLVAVANGVYLDTREGLTRLVSARAAGRVLNDVLKAQGESPEEVSAERMSELLRGPIFREFEGILPREGLRRSLNLLATKVSRQVNSAVQPEAAPDVVHASSHEAIVADGEMGASSAVAVDTVPWEDADLAVPTVSVAAPVAVAEAPTPALRDVPVDPPRPLSAAQLEQAVLLFAQLEHVKLVAAVDASGKVVSSRGGGFELAALVRLGRMALKLLERSGRPRSYYLAHSRGQLFLLPLADTTFIVVGAPELNLGAVFAALATLKEER